MTAGLLVLVTGPPRAGVTAMVGELGRRLPAHRVAEPDDLPGGERPAAVVFVVSAVAPMAESDCVSADLAFAETDAVLAVVSKIDDHRDWRHVLAADRECLTAHAAALERVVWVGAAAAPRLGEPDVDELVGLLAAHLRDPRLAERNSLRANDFRVCQLQNERDRLVARRRMAGAHRVSAAREEVAQARLGVTHAVRQRCAALRAGLIDDAAVAGRREVAAFPDRARRRCVDALAAVEGDIASFGGEATGASAPPAITASEPPLRSRRLETQLMTVLGAGFGLGVALVVTRLVTGMAPDLAVAGLIVGAVAGLATTGWVVRARALLHDRAVLQAWAGDVAAAVRAAADQRAASAMLAAEAATATANAAAAADEDASTGRRIAALDAEIRELVRARQRSNRAG